MSPSHRLLRSVALIGHPKMPTRAMWFFFIPQLLVYLYLLGPVFVYFTQGVPPREALEVISGVWRQEGGRGYTRNSIVAPKYFIDTEQGPREMHCGFTIQRRECNIYYRSPPPSGHRVTVHYDRYFGILEYEDWDVPSELRAKANLTYARGVFFYAQAKDTILWNYGAHWMLLFLLSLYGVCASFCWVANGVATKEARAGVGGAMGQIVSNENLKGYWHE
jgi:hypothetical protein